MNPFSSGFKNASLNSGSLSIRSLSSSSTAFLYFSCCLISSSFSSCSVFVPATKGLLRSATVSPFVSNQLFSLITLPYRYKTLKSCVNIIAARKLKSFFSAGMIANSALLRSAIVSKCKSSPDNMFAISGVDINPRRTPAEIKIDCFVFAVPFLKV